VIHHLRETKKIHRYFQTYLLTSKTILQGQAIALFEVWTTVSHYVPFHRLTHLIHTQYNHDIFQFSLPFQLLQHALDALRNIVGDKYGVVKFSAIAARA